MLKTHELKTVICEIESTLLSVAYFHIREKNDTNGNARHRVYIMDPAAPAVYETILKCYENQIAECVRAFVESEGRRKW